MDVLLVDIFEDLSISRRALFVLRQV